jgi:hypothetical protein
MGSKIKELVEFVDGGGVYYTWTGYMWDRDGRGR